MSSTSRIKKTGKVLLYILCTVVLLISLLFLFINLPVGKRLVKNQVQSYLGEKLKTTVRIKSIDYSLPWWIEINNVYIEDQQKDTLIYGEKISVDINMFKLVRGNTDIHKLLFKNIFIRINRAEKETAFNYQFIIDAFTGNKDSTRVNTDTATLKLTLNRLLFENVALQFRDKQGGTDFNARIQHLDASLNSFQPDRIRFGITDFSASGIRFFMNMYKAGTETVAQPVSTEKNSTSPLGLFITAGTFAIRDANVLVENKVTGLYYSNKLTHLSLSKVLFDLAGSVATGESILLDSSSVRFTNPVQIKDSSSVSSNSPSWLVKANQVSLSNNHFRYDDNSKLPAGGFDPGHINAKDITANISSFIFSADSTTASVKQLTFKDTSGLNLDTTHARFLMTGTGLSAKELYIKTPGSLIQQAIEIKYDSIGAIDRNPQSVLLAAALKNCTIAFNDLYLLSPALKKSFPPASFQDNVVQFNTEVRGNLQRIYLPALQLKAFTGSTVNAYGTLYNLTDADKFYYDLFIINSSFRKTDILKFVTKENLESLASLPDIINLKGHITGNRENLQSDVQVTGKDLAINGKFSLKNISNPAKLDYAFDIRSSSFSKQFIEGFIPPGTLPPEINLPQQLTATGAFKGDANSFVADLKLGGSYGSMTLKGYMKNMKQPDKSMYDLLVTTSSFHIGKLISQDSVLGTVTGTFKLRGNGLDYKTMHSYITASIRQLQYKQYNYQDAEITAKLDGGIIDSKGSVNDSSLQMKYDLLLNVQGEYPTINGTVQVDTVQLKNLHLYDDTLNMSFFAQVKANSIQPGILDVHTTIDSLYMQLGQQHYVLDSINLLATSSGGIDDIQFNSVFANLHANGAFDYTTIADNMARYIDHYYDIIPSKDSMGIKKQQLKFDGVIKKHPVVTALVPGLTSYDEISFNGKFSTADTDSALNFQATVPALNYQGNQIKNAIVDIHSRNEKINYLLQFDTLNYKTNSFYGTKIEGNAANDSVNIHVITQDNKRKDWFGLNGSLFAKNGTYSFRLKDSLLLNYEEWVVARDNYIKYSPEGLIIHNFSLTSDTAKIYINSSREIANSPIEIMIDNFNLRTISSLISSDTLFASGILDAKIDVDDLNKNLPAFTGNFSISDLELMQQPLGTVTGSASKQSENNITAALDLNGNNNQINARGNYYLNNTEKEFDASIDIKKLNLASLQGFTFGNIRNATGNVHGNMNLAGKFTDPTWKGALNFDTTRFTIAKMGAPLKINGQKITFDYPTVRLENFIILDSLDHKMRIDGTVTANNADSYDIDLSLNARNFIVLNVPRTTGEELYGHAAVNSRVTITGTSVAPVIEGNIVVNESSDVTIVVPERNYNKDEGNSIVRFIDQDTFQINPPMVAFTPAVPDKPAFAQFLNYNLNIEVSNKASFTIVIDPVTGDEIKVQGDAKLNAGVDPGGNIVLAGNYELNDGYYIFNYQFLQKKFLLQKGSTIMFAGAPMDAIANVTAVYEVNTSAKDLLGNEVGNVDPILANSFNQKLPFKVVLYLNGVLSKPTIRFDIQLPDNNTAINSELRTTIENKLAQIRNDESSINKQVFALLLLGRFIGEQSSDFFKGNGDDFSDLARQSVSRFLSSALNEIAGNLLKGVEIDLNLNSYRDYSNGGNAQRTDLNVALSKTFLDDRLTVSVGKNIGIEGQDATAKASQKNSFIPDVSFAYKLTKDGKYMMRAYRKSQFEVIIDGYVVETGVGFVLTMDYNIFTELFGRKKKRNRR